MNLHLLRHAIAVERAATGSADSARALTPEGARKMRRITKGMKALGLEFDLILSSPYARARQTAEIVARAFKQTDRLKFVEELMPGADAGALMELIQHLRPRPQSVLLVGHEPDLSALLSRLISGGPDAAITFKKGGLARLDAPRLRAGRCATLEWLLTPRQLAALA